MTRAVEYIDLEDVVRIATILLGDPPPIRDLGLLGAAVERPRTTLVGRDAYPDLVVKAAAMLQSVVNGNSLVDGAKRLGWVATATFLEINGVRISRASNDSVVEFVMWVASGNPELDRVASRLRDLVSSI